MTAPTKELLAEFDRLHVNALGVRAVIHGAKDAKLLASLWKTHGDLVPDLMADFFTSDDAWIRAHGYTVGMFVSQAGKLIARRARRPRLVREYWFDECTRLHGGSCESRYQHEFRKDKETQ